MAMDLSSAVVVITGASSGIGEATAYAFARKGSRVVVAARNLAALEQVAEKCRALGGQAIAVKTDVTDPQAVKALAEKAMTFGRIDVWISNVGVGAVGRFQETPLEAHEAIIRTNLLGHINDAYAVVPIFLKQRHGTFINMISLAGLIGAPFATAYSASKFGLRGFSEALRAELADHPDIHVCDIYPAFVDTPGLTHGANFVGRELGAPPPVLNARHVAQVIVDVVRAPRPTTTLGSITKFARIAQILTPNLAPRGFAKFAEAYFRRAPRIAMSDGNLYAHPPIAGGIDGGFRTPQKHPTGPILIALGATAALAVGTYLASRGGGTRNAAAVRARLHSSARRR